jgi:hypothetical protein
VSRLLGDQAVKRALQHPRSLSNEFYFSVRFAEAPAAIRQLVSLTVKNLTCGQRHLARKKWRLEGNEETGETTVEKTKTAQLLTIQDFPITLKDFS